MPLDNIRRVQYPFQNELLPYMGLQETMKLSSVNRAFRSTIYNRNAQTEADIYIYRFIQDKIQAKVTLLTQTTHPRKQEDIRRKLVELYSMRYGGEEWSQGLKVWLANNTIGIHELKLVNFHPGIFDKNNQLKKFLIEYMLDTYSELKEVEALLGDYLKEQFSLYMIEREREVSLIQESESKIMDFLKMRYTAEYLPKYQELRNSIDTLQTAKQPLEGLDNELLKASKLAITTEIRRMHEKIEEYTLDSLIKRNEILRELNYAKHKIISGREKLKSAYDRFTTSSIALTDNVAVFFTYLIEVLFSNSSDTAGHVQKYKNVLSKINPSAASNFSTDSYTTSYKYSIFYSLYNVIKHINANREMMTSDREVSTYELCEEIMLRGIKNSVMLKWAAYPTSYLVNPYLMEKIEEDYDKIIKVLQDIREREPETLLTPEEVMGLIEEVRITSADPLLAQEKQNHEGYTESVVLSEGTVSKKTSAEIAAYKYSTSSLNDFLIAVYKKELEPIRQLLEQFLKDNYNAENYTVFSFFKETSIVSDLPDYEGQPKAFFVEIRINDGDSGDYSLVVHCARDFSGDKEKLIDAVKKDYDFIQSADNVYEANGHKPINPDFIKPIFQQVQEFLLNVSENYINKMREDQGSKILWGGDIELDILARKYDLYITVHGNREAEKKNIGHANNSNKIHLFLRNNHYQYFENEPSYNTEHLITLQMLKDVKADGNCLFYAVNEAANLKKSCRELREVVCDQLEELVRQIQYKEDKIVENQIYKFTEQDNPILTRFKALFEAKDITEYQRVLNDLPPSSLLEKAKDLHQNLINQISSHSAELLQGNNDHADGLTIDSINLNLQDLIKFNNLLDWHIEAEVIAGQNVSSHLSNWLSSQAAFNHYASIIKIGNILDQKHAILLWAKKDFNGIKITFIDPLAEKDSTFKAEIEKLATSLHQEQITVQIMYSGRQDKDHGTCGDMSLVMLQELIEYGNHTIGDEFIGTNQDTRYRAMHNFDYDSYPPTLLGQEYYETI